jgi:hypothetical protein
VPFVGILIGLLALGAVVLVLLGLRLRTSVRKFGMVRGWLVDHLDDRAGMLRARSAALGIMMTNLKPVQHRNRSVEADPRTINTSVELEDNRA